MTESAIFSNERRKHVLHSILPYVILIYNLPIGIYYALQLRAPWSLLVCVLLTTANIAMFRIWTMIETGRSQLLLFYKLLAIGLTLIGLFGLLQRYCLCT